MGGPHLSLGPALVEGSDGRGQQLGEWHQRLCPPEETKPVVVQLTEVPEIVGGRYRGVGGRVRAGGCGRAKVFGRVRSGVGWRVSWRARAPGVSP
jgi:hypothetical protein